MGVPRPDARRRGRRAKVVWARDTAISGPQRAGRALTAVYDGERRAIEGAPVEVASATDHMVALVAATVASGGWTLSLARRGRWAACAVGGDRQPGVEAHVG